MFHLTVELTFLRLGVLGQGREDMYLPQSKASPLERTKGKRVKHSSLVLLCQSIVLPLTQQALPLQTLTIYILDKS